MRILPVITAPRRAWMFAASAVAAVSPTLVQAHVGHWAPVAHHDHIGLGIAIGVGVLAGLTVLGKKLKDRSNGADQPPQTEEADA